MATEDIVYRGIRFDIQRIAWTGRGGERLEKDVILYAPSVILVAMPAPGRVLMIRNERPAVKETLLELPAGGVEEGETLEQCAARELEEETGYRPERVRPLGSYYLAPSYTTELMHAYWAEGLSGGPEMQRLRPDEAIHVEPVSVDELADAVRTNRIKDGKTIAALALAAAAGLLPWMK